MIENGQSNFDKEIFQKQLIIIYSWKYKSYSLVLLNVFIVSYRIA